MMKNNSGAALIIVLFVVALAASLAVEMSSRMMVLVNKNSILQEHQQSKWYGYAAEALAKQALIQTKKDDDKVVHLKQAWAQDETTFPVDGGTISGKISDLQGCLNLNAFRAKPKTSSADKLPEIHGVFLKLLEKLDDEDSLPLENSRDELADTLLDWIDEDDNRRPEGAEEDEYLSREIPYLTANHFLASISELRTIKGFNPLIVQRILPYVCIIPGSDLFEINVNTILPEQASLLAALLDTETDIANQIISEREPEGWTDIDKFMSDANEKISNKLKNDDKQFVVNSEYFQLVANTTFADSRFKMTSMMKIKDNKVSILARKFGGDVDE
jgi:general secretion pathway protein K